MQIFETMRIVECATEIAGPYLAKQYVDLGAEVIKVEPPTGDPFRRRASGDLGGRDGALFRYLNAGKKSIVGHPEDPEVRRLMIDADMVIWDSSVGGLDHEELMAAAPHLVVVALSPYGLSGPYRDRPATEFTVQAESGSLAVRGRRDQVPFQAGGRIFDWLLGSYASVASAAALLRARSGGSGDFIDCSMIETCHLGATGFADLYHQLVGRPPFVEPARLVEVPSIEPTADGWVGVNTNTREQFESFLAMIERLDLLDEDESWASAAKRYTDLDEWNSFVWPWTTTHSTEEIIDLASAFRIPVAHVNNGETVLKHPHFKARDVWHRDPEDTFTHPLPPYRIDGARPQPPGPAPKLGEDSGQIDVRGNRSLRDVQTDERLPLAGIRVIDITNWWAGPSAGQVLAALGADVIHIESIQHPDGARMAAGAAVTLPTWWERAAPFLAANTDKRGLTLDLRSERGQKLLCDLIVRSDILLENFSPRVFEHFGLTYDAMSALNPALTMIRMPAFGLDGPWRDNVGFAQTMEQVSGMAWVTGHADDQPRILRGPCDPLAGMTAAFVALASLWQRHDTGTGARVEVSMVESALGAAAEQVIEFTAYGTILEREGNRSRDAAPQGLYACDGTEQWLAISVADDQQWTALTEVLGRPDWASEPNLQDLAGRRAAHDALDAHLADWARTQDVDDVVERLLAAGIPAGKVWDPRTSGDHRQFSARGYFEELIHPVVGRHTVPSLPFKFGSVPRWYRTAAPAMGEHNEEILCGDLGLSSHELEELERDGVIGRRPAGLE